MGRRSINTTKSGKYMNPTDQARKEARKKELKKNKKQRQMVRAAVLKGKDPAQLIEEMEKIDEMEYNVYQPSPLNEKVLKEKRKKLKETLDRVMRLYQTDDPELWSELKRKEVDYEKRRNKRVQYYESVRYAESVQVDEIPLPSATETPTSSAIPKVSVPSTQGQKLAPPISILKKPVEYVEPDISPVDNDDDEIPGCPPGPPPDLFMMKELDSDFDDDGYDNRRNKSIKFSDEVDESDDEEKTSSKSQQKMQSLSGQNIDDFMKEMETVQKKKELERENNNEGTLHLSTGAIQPTSHIPMPTNLPIAPPPNMQNFMFRPPPLRPGISSLSLRLPVRPPGMMPPPGSIPPPRLGIRMPPGPPPGPPPKHLHHNKNVHTGQNLKQSDPKSATITAKPQIRNLSADVTRFVPMAVRSKKDEIRKPKPKAAVMDTRHFNLDNRKTETKGPTKDDAYLQFMKEMEGLL